MLKISFIIFLMLSRIPLSGFQFLLLMCLLEVETNIYFGDFYWTTIAFSYLLFRHMWFKAINAPVVQSG